MISYALIGLLIIVFAWLVQLIYMKKDKKINQYFVGIYALGVATLIYDGFTGTLNAVAVVNLISFVVSVLVLIKVLKK